MSQHIGVLLVLAVLAISPGTAGRLGASALADDRSERAAQTSSTASGPGSGGARQGSPSNQVAGRSVPGFDFEWWKDAEVKRELRLTEDKAGKIDRMYGNLAREVKPLLDKIDFERTRLEQMLRERTADEAAYTFQVYQVESLWARFRESRSVMIYRMYRELAEDQYQKLREILQRRFESSGRGRGGPGAGPAGAGPTRGTGR